MNNVDFLTKIHPSIYRKTKSVTIDNSSYDVNEYFACISAIYGYDKQHGYKDNILFLIDSRLIDDEYSIQEILETHGYATDTGVNDGYILIDPSDISSSLNYIIANKDYILINQDLENGEWEYVGGEINLTYYHNLNLIGSEYNFTEDQLASFCSTFMSMIHTYANFENANINTTKNQIYIRVIDYYANGGSDAILSTIKLVLQSADLITSASSTTTSSCCGSSSTSSDEITTVDCATAYANAIYAYLLQMLSDADFYYDFFFYDDKPNADLCNMLIRLIEAFKLVGYDLSFDDSSSSHCTCSNLDKDNGTCNYNILDNYIQVLQWVRDCEIDENSNKIYVYGKEFAELLPKLMF